MTFENLVNEIAEGLNLTSTQALTRLGRQVNLKYREVMSALGLSLAVRDTTTATATVGDRYLTFTGIIKILSVFNDGLQTVTSVTRTSTTATVTTPIAHGFTTGDIVLVSGAGEPEYNGVVTITVASPTTFTYTVSGSPSTPATGTITTRLTTPSRVLGEKTFDQLRLQQTIAPPPHEYAVAKVDNASTTIFLDCVPTTAFTLTADVEVTSADLSGTDTPAFPENFHDVLIYAVRAYELQKMEKADLAQLSLGIFTHRMNELKLHLNGSVNKDTFGMATNPDRTQNRLQA